MPCALGYTVWLVQPDGKFGAFWRAQASGLRPAHHLRPADTIVAGLDYAECDAQVAALSAVELQMAATGEGATKRKQVVAM
jgi:hypothetical protein